MPIRLADYIEAAGDFSLLRDASDFEAAIIPKTALATDVQDSLEKADAYPDAGDTANHGRFLSFDAEGNPEVVDAPSGSGGQTAPQVLAAIRREVPAWTGQSSATDEMAADRMPDDLQVYIRALNEGGPRPYPNDHIQIGGVIKDSAYSPAEVRAIAEDDWGNSVTHSSATAVSPNAYCGMRFAKAEYAARPTEMPAGVVMRVAPDLPEITPVLTPLSAADTGTHWAFSVTWGPQPADDQTVVLEIVEAATSNILPPDGSITPEKLAGMPNGGVVEVDVGGQVFRAVAPTGFRTIYSGSTGVSPVSLSGNSGITRFTFDQTVDLDTAGQGIIVSDDHLRIITGPQALSFSPTSVVKTINVRGQLSLQQIGFGTAYDGGNNIGDEITTAPMYIGATEVGQVVRRIAKDADNELDGNTRYDFESGHSNIQAASISDQCHLFLLTTGAQLLPTGSVGHVTVFDDAIPAADGYQNNDVGVVEEGADRGVWVKSSEFTHGAADTGWAGKSISTGPRGNLQPVDVASGTETYRHWRWAAAAYADPRGTAQVAAGGVSPGVADLAYMDLSHLTPGNSSGQVDIVYTSARTYTGNILMRTTGAIEHDLLIPRLNATTWRLTGIDAVTVGRLLAGELVLSEPDHADTEEVHSWGLIANAIIRVVTQSEYDGMTTAGTRTMYVIIG